MWNAVAHCIWTFGKSIDILYCFGGYHIGHFQFILTLGLKLWRRSLNVKTSHKRIFKRIISFDSFLLSVWKGPVEIHRVIIIFLNFWGYPEYISNLLIIDNCSLISSFLRDQLTNVSRRFCTENDTGLVLLWLAVTLISIRIRISFSRARLKLHSIAKQTLLVFHRGFFAYVNTLTLTQKLFDEFPIGLFFLYPIKTVLHEILSVFLNINHERPKCLALKKSWLWSFVLKWKADLESGENLIYILKHT